METSEKLKEYSEKTGISLAHISRHDLKLKGKYTIYPKIAKNKFSPTQVDIIESLYNKIQ